MAQASSVDDMADEEFCRYVNDTFGVRRQDVAPLGGWGFEKAVRSGQPVQIDKVLAWLKVSKHEIVELLASGALQAPAHQADGEPVWRADDIGDLAERLKRDWD